MPSDVRDAEHAAALAAAQETQRRLAPRQPELPAVGLAELERVGHLPLNLVDKVGHVPWRPGGGGALLRAGELPLQA